jgi:hypothetical protein
LTFLSCHRCQLLGLATASDQKQKATKTSKMAPDDEEGHKEEQ